MHVTALVESPGHVCCRYRLAAFRPWLEQAGHHLELRPFPHACLARLQSTWALRSADAVVVQRRLLPRWQLHLLRRTARVLLFDLDDAVFLRNSYSPKGLHCPRRLRRFQAICRMADGIVAGNVFLQAEAARWTDPARTRVIPTCVDPNRYPTAQHTKNGSGVELAWIGSSSTLRGLDAIRPRLEDIGQRWPGLRLRLICDRFLQLRHLQVLPCPWSEPTEAEALASADIGISWIPDDHWSRGKCGLKVLQYMAAGLPVVTNPVGVHREMVRHGENGFLAETPAEWAEAIGRLAHDPPLRRQMGLAGRRRLEAEYSVQAGAERWRALLDGLARRRAAA